VATRCPQVAGRRFTVDNKPQAFLDRLDQKKGSFLCDQEGGSWRCRRIVVLDRDLRSSRKRNPQAFAPAGDLVRQLASAATVRLGEELGPLYATGAHPRTCLDLATHGCAIQAVRLRGRAPDAKGAPVVRRRLWLVEDADGTTLQCSDEALTRCDELGAAAWSALLLTVRPSSLDPAGPPPELDIPSVRVDKRGPGELATGVEGAESPAGALDALVSGKAARALPPQPPKAEVLRLGKLVETRGRPCLKEAPHATVDLTFDGEGRVLSLAVEDLPTGSPQATCLDQAVRKLALPRFTDGSYHLRATVLKGAAPTRSGRPRKR
jgi:hypothetical protein